MMSSTSGSVASTPDREQNEQVRGNRNQSPIIQNQLNVSESENVDRSVSPAADALSMLDEPVPESETTLGSSVVNHSFTQDLRCTQGVVVTSTPIAQRSAADATNVNNGTSQDNLQKGHSPANNGSAATSCESRAIAGNIHRIEQDSPSSLGQNRGAGSNSSSLLGQHKGGGSNSGTPVSDSPVTYNSIGSADSESSDVEGECSLMSSFTQTYTGLHETLKVPIVGYEIMEERARFTIFKVHVKKNPQESWFIFRRYTDFVRLNEKLSVLFPHFRLALPPKRWFGDNYDKNFLEDRQLGLQAFLNNVTSHKDVCVSKPVREFLCLDDSPGCHDTMEESKALCESLEEDMYHLQQEVEDRDRRINLLEQELDLQRVEIGNLKKALKSEKLGKRSSLSHSISSSTEHLTEADQQRYNSTRARDSGSKDNSPFKKSASKEKFQAEMNSPNRLSIIEVSEECSSTESATEKTAAST